MIHMNAWMMEKLLDLKVSGAQRSWERELGYQVWE